MGINHKVLLREAGPTALWKSVGRVTDPDPEQGRSSAPTSLEDYRPVSLGRRSHSQLSRIGERIERTFAHSMASPLPQTPASAFHEFQTVSRHLSRVSSAARRTIVSLQSAAVLCPFDEGKGNRQHDRTTKNATLRTRPPSEEDVCRRCDVWRDTRPHRTTRIRNL